MHMRRERRRQNGPAVFRGRWSKRIVPGTGLEPLRFAPADFNSDAMPSGVRFCQSGYTLGSHVTVSVGDLPAANLSADFVFCRQIAVAA